MKHDEHWLFVEFLNEGDWPNHPSNPVLFGDFNEMKEHSADVSQKRKPNYPHYCSTYVKITDWLSS